MGDIYRMTGLQADELGRLLQFPGSSTAECWGNKELSRQLTAKIRGLENDIDGGLFLHGGGLDSGEARR
jgi:hypothetical protein